VTGFVPLFAFFPLLVLVRGESLYATNLRSEKEHLLPDDRLRPTVPNSIDLFLLYSWLGQVFVSDARGQSYAWSCPVSFRLFSEAMLAYTDLAFGKVIEHVTGNILSEDVIRETCAGHELFHVL